MSYFVTGATGFIGRYLVSSLLKRKGTIHVLVRKGSEKKFDAIADNMGWDRKRVIPVSGDLQKPKLGLTAGPDVSAYKLRGVIFIIGSILAFAACIRPLGLVIASFATMIVCAAAAEDVKWRESLIVAVGVTAFCSVLFPYGLNLPFQLWPRFW